MSEFGTLPVSVRHRQGKGAARTIRREGQIPAVMYGAGKDNVLLAVDPRDLRLATDPEREWNTIFELEMRDGDSTQNAVCMVADVQRDSVRRTVTHLDFIRIDPDREVVREVPVAYHGRSVGVQKGGKLKVLRRHVRVSAKPSELPVAVRVDVSNVDSGDALRVRDIEVENVRLIERPDQRLCMVEMPKVKKEDEAEEEGAAPKAAAPKAAAPKA